MIARGFGRQAGRSVGRWGRLDDTLTASRVKGERGKEQLGMMMGDRDDDNDDDDRADGADDG